MPNWTSAGFTPYGLGTDIPEIKEVRKYPIVEIEDVTEPFCGLRRKNMVPLSEAFPEIAEEWHYKKNCGWGPEDFSRSSGVRAWWKCPDCKRAYRAQICNRTGNKSGCPYCASKRVCEDNSLQDNCPEVAAEWHPTKNGELTARDVTRATNKHVWWLCSKCAHSWPAAIACRTTQDSGCPACYEARMQYAREHPKISERKRWTIMEKGKLSRKWYEKPSNADFVSIVETHYSIAKQWHPTKNGGWTAFDFSKGSDTKVWWKCKKGPDHEWVAPIYARTGRKSGCPFCSGFRLSITNTFKNKFPQIAKEWHSNKNGNLKPDGISCVSRKKVWWQCKRNESHEWQTTVPARIKGTKCPYCSHLKVNKETSIKGQNPSIAAELHPTKNGALNASELAPLSGRKVWWLCKKNPDHEWQATPGNRVSRGSGCPYCAGKRVTEDNSLAALYPTIAAQWDKKRNGDLKPEAVSAGSKIKAWWCCAQGHVWQQAVFKRTSSKRIGLCWECKTGRKRPAVMQAETTKKPPAMQPRK